MSKKISIVDILKSRYGSDKNNPAWVDERRSICNSCPLNSKNKPKEEWTAQEKAWVMANHGKDTCLACKCMISAKTKIPHAVCGLKNIGETPKWYPVQSIKRTGNIEIENLSTDKVTATEKDNEIWLDYGTIKLGEDTDIQILIKDVNNNMTNIQVGAGCHCTSSNASKVGKDIILNIIYDNKKTGNFTKTVFLTYEQNKIKYKKIFKITGKTI